MKIRNQRVYHDNGSAVSYLESPNHSGSFSAPPRYLIIHYTAGGGANGSISWLRNPAAQASAHFVIGRDGTCTQLLKLDRIGWHAGTSRWGSIRGLNRHSIGIELANWGRLLPSGDGWRSTTGASVDTSRVVSAAHKHTPGDVEGWESFTEAQIDTAVELASTLAAHFDWDEGSVLGHDDISPGRKIDPGPAWPMRGFKARLFGRASDEGAPDTLWVDAASGLNMREGPGIHHTKIKTLKPGTAVMPVEQQGAWRLVAEVENGEPDTTGWVHGRWLRDSKP